MSTKTRIARLEKSLQSGKHQKKIAFCRPNGTYWVEGMVMSAPQFDRWREAVGRGRVLIIRFSPE